MISKFREELAAGWLVPPRDLTSIRGMKGQEFGLNNQGAAKLCEVMSGEGVLPRDLAGFAQLGKIGMETASAIFLITTKNDDLKSRITAGRLFQRLALLLQANDFTTAIHAAITETSFPQIKIATLMLKATQMINGNITVCARTGQPKHEEDRRWPHSARPSPGELLLG